jgi:hypothetical protein
MLEFTPSTGRFTARCLVLSLFLIAFSAFSTNALAQDPVHGVSFAKSCTNIPRTCDADTDCTDDTGNECTESFCNTSLDRNLRCIIEVRLNDDFLDTIDIENVTDVIHADLGDDTSTPRISFVSGITTCVVGPFVPCTIGPEVARPFSTQVQFIVDGYLPTSDDPNPLLDDATLDYLDECDGTDDVFPLGNCVIDKPDVGVNGSTATVSGCGEQNKSNSTPCGDTGLDCWDAGCFAATPDDTATCVQEHVPVSASTVCDEVAGTECADPGCDGSGTCVADHINKSDSTICGDTGEECWDAGCESGLCVQQHVALPCGDEICRTPGFWGARGGIEKAPKSQNITQAVIDKAIADNGFGLAVCGIYIDNTDLLSNVSAIEAMCVSVKGVTERQLVRQLTAAALNCGLAPCNDEHVALVADCNAICASGVGDMQACIDDLDYFNNGGGGEGFCEIGLEPCSDVNTCVGLGDTCLPSESCHDRNLCPDFEDDGEINGSDFCFEPPGPASSSRKCNTARKNDTYVP